VAVADVEFVQFHPTALHHPAMPRPLLSEALRGHGALLRGADGERFVDELLPRDQVSRAITARLLDDGTDHVWLDATQLERFDERFPTIARSLAEIGLDAGRDWLPVAPAAHYLCGGIVADLDGATTLPGLWAAGEAACNGVHGANRLASNSLLDGMVFAPRVVEAVDRGRDGPEATGAMRCVLAGEGGPGGPVGAVAPGVEIVGRPLGGAIPPPAPAGRSPSAGPVTASAEGTADRSGPAGAAAIAEARDALQRAMTASAGVLRSADSLADASAALDGAAALAAASHATGVAGELRRAAAELANLVTIGRVLTAAAGARTESRGAHARTDHPGAWPAPAVRLVTGGPPATR
jgi:L-aspartate oxidase